MLEASTWCLEVQEASSEVHEADLEVYRLAGINCLPPAPPIAPTNLRLAPPDTRCFPHAPPCLPHASLDTDRLIPA